MTSGAGATYSYNAQGLRVAKTVGGETDSFTLVGGNVWSDGTTDYLRGIELIASDTNLYLYNIRGDVIQLVGFDGEVAKTYDYDAYGNELQRDLNDENPFRYCGEYYDTETGFIYLRARYYDPMVGRFTSVDPIKDGLNWYAYCAGNPVAFVDPTGESLENVNIEEQNSENEAVWKGVVVIGGGLVLIGLTALSLATFGATSGFTIMALCATVSYWSNEAEIGMLQGRKSYADGDSTKEIANDIAIAMFDNSFTSNYEILKSNAVDYLLISPTVDSVYINNGSGFALSKESIVSNYSNIKDVRGNLAKSSGEISLIYSYVGMFSSVSKVFIAADYHDYEYVAKERGYILR